MKKTLLLLAAFATVSASAQYKVTTANIPVINDINTTAVDTTPNIGIDAGAAGTGQVFLVSDVDLDLEETTIFEDPSVYQSSIDFPNASVAFQIGTGGTAFGQIFANQFDIVGSEFTNPLDGSVMSITWDNPLSVLRYPYGFGDTYKDTGHFRTTFFVGQNVGVQIDSARIDYTVVIDAEVDASGSMETINGTFVNVIRDRQVQTETNVTEVCIQFVPGFPCQWQDAGQFTGESSAPVTTVEYYYYGSQSKFPYAQLTYNENEDTLQSVSINLDEFEPSSISDIKKLGNLVYPNPAKTSINVTASQNATVTISDFTGRTIVSQIGGGSINIENLNNGSYILTITDNNTVFSGQLIKN